MKDNFISHSAARLKEERARLGLDQAKAGELCGVSREMWGKYERGKAVPGGEVLFSFSAAGADVQYILTGIRSANAVTEPANHYAPLNQRERDLLDNYRHIADEEGKRYVEKSALLAVEAAKDEAQSGTSKKRA